MHAVNGTSPLESGKGRSLVCHFANVSGGAWAGRLQAVVVAKAGKSADQISRYSLVILAGCARRDGIC